MYIFFCSPLIPLHFHQIILPHTSLRKQNLSRKNSHFPTKFAQLSAFIPKSCLLSCNMEELFLLLAKAASPFVLQVAPLSAFPCSLPFLRSSFSLDYSQQWDVPPCFLALSITEPCDSTALSGSCPLSIPLQSASGNSGLQGPLSSPSAFPPCTPAVLPSPQFPAAVLVGLSKLPPCSQTPSLCHSCFP